jgi:hypothetical protein
LTIRSILVDLGRSIYDVGNTTTVYESTLAVVRCLKILEVMVSGMVEVFACRCCWAKY